MMRYLEDEPISMDELASGLKQCVADGVVVPVLVRLGGVEPRRRSSCSTPSSTCCRQRLRCERRGR